MTTLLHFLKTLICNSSLQFLTSVSLLPFSPKPLQTNPHTSPPKQFGSLFISNIYNSAWACNKCTIGIYLIKRVSEYFFYFSYLWKPHLIWTSEWRSNGFQGSGRCHHFSSTAKPITDIMADCTACQKTVSAHSKETGWHHHVMLVKQLHPRGGGIPRPCWFACINPVGHTFWAASPSSAWVFTLHQLGGGRACCFHSITMYSIKHPN